jgi:hypothetical protein
VWLAVAVSSPEAGAPAGLQAGGHQLVSSGWEGSLEVGEACGVKAWSEFDGRRPVAVELTEEDGSAGVLLARHR